MVREFVRCFSPGDGVVNYICAGLESSPIVVPQDVAAWEVVWWLPCVSGLVVAVPPALEDVFCAIRWVVDVSLEEDFLSCGSVAIIVLPAARFGPCGGVFGMVR